MAGYVNYAGLGTLRTIHVGDQLGGLPEDMLMNEYTNVHKVSLQLDGDELAWVLACGYPNHHSRVQTYHGPTAVQILLNWDSSRLIIQES
jgi:hypothetical protein